ncbi:C-C chemokine receptor type 10 [Ctenopharyngodon idella]|uniref:C-X-C motif chemokine receptor 10 n=1 Tax=Ctenopharyngodon idella TaxID=7959 RepID=A0A345D775_CTEID|nr:C-C chemokine receptor type 10 [Ctenopharyngodon idella]AXF84205.1 C-X-C motif chemokine receptor 10 [Ctenopharyngodon idella]
MASSDSTTEDFTGLTFDYGLNYTDFEANVTELAELCEASREQELTITAVQTTVFLIVFILGVIGNGLVIATFALYRRLRLRCMTDVFLFYLALSDMLLLLTLPLQTGEVLIGSWVFGEALCKLNRGMYAINTCSGLLLLACISVDRYLVVVRTKAVRNKGSGMLFYSTLSAFGVAVTSIILSLPDLCFSSIDNNMGSDDLLCDMKVWGDEVSKWKLWAQMAKIAGFCIPCVAMVVCYGAIGRVLIRAGGKCWRRQRTLRLMALLVVLFLLFQLPYTVVLLIKIFTPKPKICEKWTRFHLLENVTRNLACVRCCLNPLLYALVGVRFRNDIIRLLTDAGCVCACVSHIMPHHENGSSVTPSSPAPTTLSPISSTYQSSKKTPGSDTPAANTGQTFIFPTPISGKVTSVISWCHQ